MNAAMTLEHTIGSRCRRHVARGRADYDRGSHVPLPQTARDRSCRYEINAMSQGIGK